MDEDELVSRSAKSGVPQTGKGNRKMFPPSLVAVTMYTALIIGAEVISILLGAIPGILCHVILLFMLLNHYCLADKMLNRQALPLLALVPLIRIISFTTLVQQIPRVYWYVTVGVPILVAAILIARLVNISVVRFKLMRHTWLQLIIIGLSGLPLSTAGFFILRPEPLISNLNWTDVLIGSIILVVFTGFLEELIFRGMLQQMFGEMFGSIGAVIAGLLFASTYIGSLSPSYVLFIALVGLFFGACVHLTRSIWGAVAAHSLLNVGMLLLWPVFGAGLLY